MKPSTEVSAGRVAVSSDARSSKAEEATPERIYKLSETLSSRLDDSIREIQAVNLQTSLLSFNAQIEAARAGEAGASFAVVAAEMNALANTTTKISNRLRDEMLEPIQQLKGISATLASNVRGTRLTDLALVNIDLIDRNLYERSCDVRWWATDASFVQAAHTQDGKDCTQAAQRMGVILNAYTVYADLVLCDTQGNVLANGRPEKHPLTGRNFAAKEWFRNALKTASGEEFGFESVHRVPEVENRFVLVYSCAVREGGGNYGKPIGVLGILFKWEDLAQTIVKSTPVSEEEKRLTRCMITTDDGTILADSDGHLLENRLEFRERTGLFSTKKAYIETRVGHQDCLVAHARSPGFETYATGWHSVILQGK